MKHHQTSSSTIDASCNALRKVRSLDCVTPTRPIAQHTSMYPPTPSIIPALKASRFSVQAQKYKITPTLDYEEFQDPCKTSSSSSVEVVDTTNNLSRSHFVSMLSPSSSAVSLVGLVDSTDQDYTLLCSIFDSMRGHFRFSRLVNAFVFSLLILATMARYRKNDDTISSQKRLTTSLSNLDSGKNHRGLLGPAMIESVTEALSPILPFAGGVDLRRDEHWSFVTRWSNILWMTTSSEENPKSRLLTEKSNHLHRSLESIPRGGGSLDISTRQNPITTLSMSEPFIPRSQIAEMNLTDIAFMLKYAVDSSKPGFDRDQYFQQGDHGKAFRTELINILDSLDEAATKSRGFLLQNDHDVFIFNGIDSQETKYGNVDALQFCAAIRIFAEWRLVRQVPEGYKGYAVGMSLGHKDIVQNLAKIENSAHEWLNLYYDVKNYIHSEVGDTIAVQDDDDSCCSMNERLSARQRLTFQSPTLRDLLTHEIKADIHPTKKLPILKEKSAAMGLLWVRRQCQYQNSIFSNVLKIPSVFSSAVHAVSSAYSEVYGNLHGWAVQKIFSYSFQAAPDIHVIFRHMNPSLLDELLSENHLKEYVQDSNQPAESMNRSFQECTTESESTHHLNSLFTSEENGNGDIKRGKIEEQNMIKSLGNEFDKIGRLLSSEITKIGIHIGNEWDKFTSSIFGLFKPKVSELNTYEARGGAVSVPSKLTGSMLSGEALEQFISMKMSSDAKDRITLFLSVAQPLLSDLAGLFEELNMDDPTRV